MLRTGIACLAVMMFMATTVEAQDFRALSTRRGALIGAGLGAIAGAQNDEALAGIAIGGLVGGAAGRYVGNRLNYDVGRAYNNGFAQGSYYQQPQYYSQPSYNYQPYGGRSYSNYGYRQPYYRGSSGCSRGW